MMEILQTLVDALPVIGSAIAVIVSLLYKWLTARPKMREGLAADPIGFASFIYEVIGMMLTPATILVYGDEIAKLVQNVVAIIINDLEDGKPDTLRELNLLLQARGVSAPPKVTKYGKLRLR